MKKLYFLLIAFSFFSAVNAQIVNIPDAKFKATLLAANSNSSYAKNLLGVNFKIDANNDGEIQETEALQVSYLSVGYSYPAITSLVGIEKFLNLQNLYCEGDKLTSLNVSNLTKLQNLSCGSNSLTFLDLTSCTALKALKCSGNRLVFLIVNGLTNLQLVECYNNNLSSLDLTGCINLTKLVCYNNKLTSLNLTGLTNLSEIQCFSNSLSSLDVMSSPNLKTLSCYSNQLTSLNLSTLKNIQNLYCGGNKLASLDVTTLTNIQSLDCSNNQLTSLDVTTLTNIQFLDCSNNQLSSLDVNGLINLKDLRCESNQLQKLDVSMLSNIYSLYCQNNLIKKIDISTLQGLYSLDCRNNKLEELYLKNGKNIISEIFAISNNPTLKYVCVDDTELTSIQSSVNSLGYTNCVVNSYCSFVPGGTFYTIQGNQKLDSNNNGCDVNDFSLPNLKYTITSVSTSGSLISNVTGNYSIPVLAGTHTITPILENPTYFTVSPTTVNVTFPTQTSPFTQNFCITPNGVRPDLEVILLPLQPARPGFDAKYQLVYKNKGNISQSGAVNLTFTDAVLDLVVANPVTTTQTVNNLSWNFTNLQPFETREISFTMNVNSPMEIPAITNGDILAYTSTITSSATDETPADNTFTFNQTVVGSYDPNDKTCLEGSVITPNLIGQYVHYMIRFENTGTFAAENVVVKDMIDLTKFDISTLVPTSASHSYTTRISEGNKVEFIFENINLPFDDANNDGYIAFKIKTKPTLVVNDSFSNEASIFFDYNFPILTNKVTSTFKTLGTKDFDFNRYFTVYPNPASTVLNIASKESINVKSMSVYNTLGQLVLAIPNAEKVSNVDVSNLKSGNYFIQIKTDKGSSSSKFVKE